MVFSDGCCLCDWHVCCALGKVRLDKGIYQTQGNVSLSASRPMIKDDKENAGIMPSCHCASPRRRPTLLLLLRAANGSYVSHCGCAFTRKNNSSNRSWKFTLNALPKYESASFHIRVCVTPSVCVEQIARCILDGCDN